MRWVVVQNHKRFWEFWTPFPLCDIRKNPRSMYARVPQAMAQFVLKIENCPISLSQRNTRNGERLWSPSLVMAPDINKLIASKKAEADYRYLLGYVYNRGNCSGFLTNPGPFGTGLILLFTRLKLPGLVLSPEILNPEFKVGTLNLETFESGEFWCFSASKLLSLQ